MSVESSYQADLTQKERIYVESRLQGMTMVASARAAGVANPEAHGSDMEKRPKVQAAMVDAMEQSAAAVGFSRKEAHDLLMSAYYNADTAGEQIAAVRELIKLHGVAAPQQVEHKHTHEHSGELSLMSTEELMKLADMKDDLVIEGDFENIEDLDKLEFQGTDAAQADTQELLPDVSVGD